MQIFEIQPPKSPCFPAGTYVRFSVWTSEAGMCLVFPQPQLLNFSKYRKNVSLPFTASSDSRIRFSSYELIVQELIKSSCAWFSLEGLGLALLLMQLCSVSPFPFILELHSLVLQVGRKKMNIQVNLQALASLGGNNLLKAVEAKSPLSHYSTFPAMETLSCLRGRGGPTHLILQRCCNNSSWKARNRLV